MDTQRRRWIQAIWRQDKKSSGCFIHYTPKNQLLPHTPTHPNTHTLTHTQPCDCCQLLAKNNLTEACV